MPDTSYQIAPVGSDADLRAVRQLFSDYAQSLAVDLSYQDFSAELAGLPGQYSPPHGELLMACDCRGKAVACVGLRPIGPAGCCEMKRLYVSPHGRGMGIGTALINAIILEAERKGYHEIRLDTLPTMTDAISLYRKLGFVSVEPYYESPIAGTIYLAKALPGGRGAEN